MSSFAGLTGDSGKSDEIESENQCRNKRKKLRQLREKLCNSDVSKQEELEVKIKILEIQIDEWEEKQKAPTKKQGKQKKNRDAENKRKRENKKKKEEDELLERESAKNREYWKKYNAEKERDRERQRDREKRERKRRTEERKRWEEEADKRKAQDRWRNTEQRWERERRNQMSHKPIDPVTDLFERCKITDNPSDIRELYTRYDKKKYHKLTIKYHPDKSSYHVGYITALNRIKDKHNPVQVKHDETWTK